MLMWLVYFSPNWILIGIAITTSHLHWVSTKISATPAHSPASLSSSKIDCKVLDALRGDSSQWWPFDFSYRLIAVRNTSICISRIRSELQNVHSASLQHRDNSSWNREIIGARIDT
jgi:hypothetical protein